MVVKCKHWTHRLFFPDLPATIGYKRRRQREEYVCGAKTAEFKPTCFEPTTKSVKLNCGRDESLHYELSRKHTLQQSHGGGLPTKNELLVALVVVGLRGSRLSIASRSCAISSCS